MSAAETQVSLCGKLGLRPLNATNIMFYYAPIQGVLSYTSLSINVMNPTLVLRLFPKRDITNVLLCHSLLGAGLYLFSRQHLTSLAFKDRVLYSAFGSLTFTMGSVLIWAILRSVVPQNVVLCTACGVGSGLALLKIGRSYAEFLDTLVEKKAN